MQAVLQIETLPEAALDASGEFSRDWLPVIREHLSAGENLIAVLPAAAYDHTDWRRAAARDLARAHAPARINFVSGGNETSIAETVEYLSDADGVTGQYLPLHDSGEIA